MLCDDDRAALDVTARFVDEFYAGLCQIRAFSDPAEAVRCAVEEVVDLALLDIVMPGMSGVDLARQLHDAGCACAIAFLSHSNEYASESYRVGAIDYLLKPVLREDIQRLLSGFEQRRQRVRPSITVPKRSGARRICADELCYVEVINHHLHFHLEDGETVRTRAQLGEYLDALLQMEPMMRCHRSYVVNLDHVRAYAPGEVVMRGGERISVTGSFQQFEAACLSKFFGKREG